MNSMATTKQFRICKNHFVWRCAIPMMIVDEYVYVHPHVRCKWITGAYTLLLRWLRFRLCRERTSILFFFFGVCVETAPVRWLSIVSDQNCTARIAHFTRAHTGRRPFHLESNVSDGKYGGAHRYLYRFFNSYLLKLSHVYSFRFYRVYHRTASRPRHFIVTARLLYDMIQSSVTNKCAPAFIHRIRLSIHSN